MTIIDRLTALWRRTPSAIRAGWVTAWLTFTGLMLTIIAGILPDLATAISDRNFQPFYNSLSLAATAALSAVSAFVVGCLNAVYRWLHPIAEAYKSEWPPPLPPDAGHASLELLASCALVGLIAVVALAPMPFPFALALSVAAGVLLFGILATFSFAGRWLATLVHLNHREIS